jgi:hypothetical protein
MPCQGAFKEARIVESPSLEADTKQRVCNERLDRKELEYAGVIYSEFRTVRLLQLFVVSSHTYPVN